MPEQPSRAPFGEEIHIPSRPYLGRIERTRFAWIANAVEGLFAKQFERKIEEACLRRGATAIHSVSHGATFMRGYRVARRLRIPYFLSLHDDLGYLLEGHPRRWELVEALGEVWCGADARFAISDELGKDCSARYGERVYHLVTDGLESLSEARQVPDQGLHIYFMGLFHVTYEDNLRALLHGLRLFGEMFPTVATTVTCRCGTIRPEALGRALNVRILPFGSEADVQSDLQKANLLYLPLPFQPEAQAFARFSLSTKMITYLGSGIQTLYHGPADAAACRLLRDNNAAWIVNSLDGAELKVILQQAFSDANRRAESVRNGMALARRRFMLRDQRERFWTPIQQRLERSCEQTSAGSVQK
jgi:hypothetical protein